MLLTRQTILWAGVLFAMVSSRISAEDLIDDSEPLQLPKVGAHRLRIITPRVLELTLITTKNPDPALVGQWNFVSTNGVAKLPAPREFAVTGAGANLPIEKVGFKRRVLYAPLRQRDLRIENNLYLILSRDVPENAAVEVRNPTGRLWPAAGHFIAKTEPSRWSPVVHVNQLGYLPGQSKKAMTGYYMGSLDELAIGPAGQTNGSAFSVIETASGKTAFTGQLRKRRDNGFPFRCYENVWEADFSELRTPGEYRLSVPPMGGSFSFWIGEGVAAGLARTYAAGVYHQRCGTNNVFPYTRHTHGVCHAAPAQVPLPEQNFAQAWKIIAGKTDDAGKNPRHVAAPLKDANSCLYPFIRTGEIDVSGGHHDAGDYSKYTINSALFIHQLVFAADVFPGVADLDNLGIPESGDGKSDILQEAKWEADFLAKMQDDDGGFYFLVYPREREYEGHALPDQGDPQIVWPKTTAVTAGAVAALAQCASSPQFKKQFPEAAALYLAKAKKGWQFLEQAIKKYGNDGAYQKITHYGDEFMHDDELAWAACEMFLATHDQSLHTRLRHLYNPNDSHIRKWSWWRLYEGYGCATRSYAFAVKAGKLARGDADIGFLSKCENEIIAAGEDQIKRAESSAYGTSFPIETKRTRSAGWYFAGDPAFDLAVAYQLDYPVKNDLRPRLMEALLSNFNYELGCNPVNVCFMTGLGAKRQREIVHQYALNDRQVLPPAGIPLGCLQSGFGWLDLYQRELGALSFPLDGDKQTPYPIYDRWGDSFNLSTEFVILNQARGLAATAFLMAQTSLRIMPWKRSAGEIAQAGQNFNFSAGAENLAQARVIWEASGEEPRSGLTFHPSQNLSVISWVEAEAVLPNGSLIVGKTNRTTSAPAATSAKR